MTNKAALRGYWWRFMASLALGDLCTSLFKLLWLRRGPNTRKEWEEYVNLFLKRLRANLGALKCLEIDARPDPISDSPEWNFMIQEMKTNILAMKKDKVESLTVNWSLWGSKGPFFIFHQPWPSLRYLCIKERVASGKKLCKMISSLDAPIEHIRIWISDHGVDRFLPLLSEMARAKQQTLRNLDFFTRDNTDESFAEALLPSEAELRGLSLSQQQDLILQRYHKYFTIPITDISDMEYGSLWNHVYLRQGPTHSKWDAASIALHTLCSHPNIIKSLQSFNEYTLSFAYARQQRENLIFHYCSDDFDGFAVKYAPPIVSWLKESFERNAARRSEIIELVRRIVRQRPSCISSIDHRNDFDKALFQSVDWLDQKNLEFPELIRRFATPKFPVAMAFPQMLPYVIEYLRPVSLLLENGDFLHSLLAHVEAIPAVYGDFLGMLLDKYSQNPSFIPIMLSAYGLFSRKPIDKLERLSALLHKWIKVVLQTEYAADLLPSLNLSIWKSVLPHLAIDNDAEYVDLALKEAWGCLIATCCHSPSAFQNSALEFWALLNRIPRLEHDYVASKLGERHRNDLGKVLQMLQEFESTHTP